MRRSPAIAELKTPAAVRFGEWLDANVNTRKSMARTQYEIELETKLMKAWAETVYEHHLREEAVSALNDLNCRAHSNYDFNADPDRITLKVGSVLTEQWPHFEAPGGGRPVKASNDGTEATARE